uniref:Uncharacterized protein n=1 Tax=Pithovirus LCPAC404 TaxID=2506597 RepID=A0A481ZC46_9VIRU|nr:MAG: uncharacterized protein LCPAC404_01520 [Pithovirus LCPAC404]
MVIIELADEKGNIDILQEFYTLCRTSVDADTRKLLSSLRIKFELVQFSYIVSWGIVLACGNNNGDSRTAHNIIDFLELKVICLHEGFLLAKDNINGVTSHRSKLNDNDKSTKIDLSLSLSLKPKGDMIIKYDLPLMEFAGCRSKKGCYESTKESQFYVNVHLLDETFDREKVDSRVKQFLDTHGNDISRAASVIPLCEIYDTCVKEDSTIFADSGWKTLVKTNRTEVKIHNSDPDYLYKFPIRGSYRLTHNWSHVLRVRFGAKLRELVVVHDFDKLEIVEENLTCLKSLHDILELKNDNLMIEQFVVRSEFKYLMGEAESANFLANQSLADKLEFSHQLIQLVCFSGFSDVNLGNIRIDRKSGKLVIIDTEPIYGSMYLEGEKIKKTSLKERFSFIMLPACLSVFYEVLNSYFRNIE